LRKKEKDISAKANKTVARGVTFSLLLAALLCKGVTSAKWPYWCFFKPRAMPLDSLMYPVLIF